MAASGNDYGPDNTPQALAFEKVSGPGTINPATGEYTWLVPYNTAVSTVDVTLRVRDGRQR